MNYIEIGQVLKPQGLKGQIKVRAFDESFFDNLKAVHVKNNKYIVKHCAVRQGFAYLDLVGIDIIEKAEEMRGAKLFVAKNDIKLKAEEFLTEDIIGFSIVSKSGNILGRLIEVNNYGGGNVFDCGNFMFPYTNEFVIKIDNEKKQIVVDEKMLEEEVI